MSNRWSLLASYGYTRSYDNNNTTYQGNSVRNNALPATPNDKINTDDGRHLFSRQNVKLSGTWNSPWWDITFSPMLRYQEGFPFGRTFQVSLKWLQTAISLRHSDTVDVKFILESEGGREEKTIALEYEALLKKESPSFAVDLFERLPPGAMVILDELNIALRYEYLDLAEVVGTISGRRNDLHVVVTGRNAKPELVAAADLVTEMTLVKHHFAAGVKAQPGIEF